MGLEILISELLESGLQPPSDVNLYSWGVARFENEKRVWDLVDVVGDPRI